MTTLRTGTLTPKPVSPVLPHPESLPIAVRAHTRRVPQNPEARQEGHEEPSRR